MSYSIPTGTKALSFDIWLTLLNGNKAFTRPRLQLIFDLLGVPIDDMDAVAAAYRTSDRKYNNLMEETGKDFGFFPRLAHIFRELNVMCNLPGDEKIHEIQTAIGQLRCRPEYMPTFIEPDLPATLAALRDEGYTLGLLSNTGMDDHEVMEPVLKALGIRDYFATALFTSDVGLAKPEPELFHQMAKKLGVEIHDMLHIGDNKNADYRATEAGAHAVVYAPKGIEGYPFITSMKELLRK